MSQTTKVAGRTVLNVKGKGVPKGGKLGGREGRRVGKGRRQGRKQGGGRCNGCVEGMVVVVAQAQGPWEAQRQGKASGGSQVRNACAGSTTHRKWWHGVCKRGSGRAQPRTPREGWGRVGEGVVVWA